MAPCVFIILQKRESGQEQQFMEDKKRKKEEKRKREASQKVSLLEVDKILSNPHIQSPGGAATPSQGGNNAKRLAVANGQPPSRYMPREVPPRFRCQQDHKVLLKRGQPPLSSMLLGGGGGGGDGPNPNMAAVSGNNSASSLALTSSIAASTSNYANSMWGTSSGGQASSQGKEKVIVDGNDLEEWPSIAGSDGGNGGNSGMPVNSISASGNQPSPTSSFSLPNECMQLSNSAAWGTTASQGQLGGGAAVAAAGPLLQQPSSLSKAPAVHGSHDASGPVDGSSGIPGANFSPNANPSAWPALVQQDSPAAAGEGALTAFHHQGSGGSANNSASMGQGGGAVGVLGGHPSISVNQSSAHQHQLHQMQSRDREAGGGKWDSESAGPKISGGEGIGGGMDHGVGGGRVGAGDPNVATSWRGQPSYSAAYSKTGVSRTDGWEGGESGGLGAAEGDKGTSGWGYPSSTCGSAENGGNCGQTSGATQGGWGLSVVGADRGASGSGWGGSSAGIGGSNPAPDEMGNCSSNSSSSGGSTVGNPPTASSSLTAAAANRAWDNQKGEGEVGEWGDGAGGRGGSSSSGGNSRSGSMTNSNRIRRQAPNAEAALQNLLSRSDLDPRVLSNSGWGQTQIRQNTSWDVEEQEGHNKAGPPSASSKHPAAIGGPTQYSSGPRTLSTDSKGPGVSPSLIPPTGSSGEGWESSSSNSSSSGASLSGRAPPPTSSNMRHLGVSQSGPVTSSAPGLASGIMPGTQAKATGWVGGGNGAGDNLDSKEWGNEEWRSNSQAEKGGGWGDVGQKGDSSGGGWGDGHHEKGAGSWKDMGGSDEGSGWGSKSKVGAGKNWLEQESKSSSGGGWGDGRRNGGHSGGDSGGGGWGNWDSSAPRRTWGTGGGGGGGGGMDGVGGMGPKPHQGWSGGNKMHQMPNSQSGSVSGPQAQLQQQQSQPRNQNPQLQQALDQGVMQGGGGRKLASQAQTQNQSSGWTSGPLPCAPGGGGGPEPSGWEEPSPQSISRKSEIDDGTSAWGDPTHYNYKPVNLWDKNSGSANLPNATVSTSTSKSMQDGWGDKESSMAASRHSSWEDEEEGSSMWNSTGSQGSGSSWGQGSNGGWGPLKAGGDSWMSPINRQFSNMGILVSGPNIDLPPGSIQEKKMEAEKRGIGLNDFNGDMRKGGRGGGPSGGGIYRPPGSKDPAQLDAGSYYDKGGHSIFGNAGGMSQSRHQPSVPPMNQSPGMRAQVPHQFLSPQACQLLLQQQQQQQPPQQQQILQNQRKFTPNVRQQNDPQQVLLCTISFCKVLHMTVALLNPSSSGSGFIWAGPCSMMFVLIKVREDHRAVGDQWVPRLPTHQAGLLVSDSTRFKQDRNRKASFTTINGLPACLVAPFASQTAYMIVPAVEFQPGVPWKGIDRVDPESDPYMTPGSMMGNAVSPGLNDSEHQLLQDNTDSTPPLNTLLPSPGAWPYSASDILNNAHNSAKYTEYKTSWPPEPPGHKSWKASRGSSQAQLSRPPPGLASQKQASPSPWSGGAPRSAGRGSCSSARFLFAGSAWSDGSSRESCWLVLSNLTPQIDGSTLRTICMQHGPLLTFHLGLTQGTALIRYCSKQEAAKAQSALHMCVLGNTTILAEFVRNAAASAGWQSLDSTGSSSDPSAAQGPGLGIFTQWSSNGSGVGGAGAMEAGRQGLWGGIGGMSGAGYPSGGSSLWASPALEDRHQMGSPAALLPGDLLGGGADSI
uniref:Trinucleotide repeat containing adaptor 6B n=1 Tax=Cyprinodon variegatus TaxID=28743 RepID=A0A3Q2DKT1_CYPVA